MNKFIHVVVAFTLVCLSSAVYSQNKMGKINFYTVISQDPLHEKKSAILQNFADSLYDVVNELPEVQALYEEMEAIDDEVKNAIYYHKVGEVQGQLRKYEEFIEGSVFAKRLSLYYNDSFTLVLKSVVERDNLDGMMMLSADSVEFFVEDVLMGIEFMSNDFDNQLTADIENFQKRQLFDDNNGEDEFYQSLNATVMSTDYTDNVLKGYIAEAKDYTDLVIKQLYGM